MSLINGCKLLTFSSGDLIALDTIILTFYGQKMFSSKLESVDTVSPRPPPQPISPIGTRFQYDNERTFVAPAPYWLQQRRDRRASAGGGLCLGIWSFWCVHTIVAAAVAALLQSPTPPTTPPTIRSPGWDHRARCVCKRSERENRIINIVTIIIIQLYL